MTLIFVAVCFRLDVSPFVVSFLCFLFEVILRIFGAITGYLNWGVLFCRSQLPFCLPRWPTLGVPFVYDDFWLSGLSKILTWECAPNLLYLIELRDRHVPFVFFHQMFIVTQILSCFRLPFSWIVAEAQCYGSRVHNFELMNKTLELAQQSFVFMGCASIWATHCSELSICSPERGQFIFCESHWWSPINFTRINTGTFGR